LSAEYRYIATSLPRLIVESFDSGAEPATDDAGPASDTAGTMAHTYSATERESYSASLITHQAQLALRALSAAVRQRDALLFEKAVTAERREAVEQTVIEARAALDALNLMDPSGPEIQPVKPIEFWSGRPLGRLLEPVPIGDDLAPDEEALEEIALDANLDLLIWGVVEEIRGYLKVDFYAYSPYGAGIDLGEAGTVALPSDIGQESEIIAGEIAAALLGRPWGSVFVRTDVNDAAILVDGVLAGFRQASARYLIPGDVTIEVVANGYRTQRQVVTVTDRQTTSLTIDLEQILDRVVRIESAPADADVYVDSVWSGLTPLDLSVPYGPVVVRLRREGYLESRFVIDSDSPDRIARALLPDSVVWADELQEKRDGFYRAMTWFVVSVPVTLILNGVYQSVLSAFPPDDPAPLTPENWERFGRIGNIFYWASAGGLLVNLGLLVNVGINLFDYLEVGEGAHNQ
jgi:PEGA domain